MAKTGNEYARAFGDVYEKTPKAVFAAVAFGFTSAGGDRPEGAVERFMEEWWAQHLSGIIPQKPPVPMPEHFK